MVGPTYPEHKLDILSMEDLSCKRGSQGRPKVGLQKSCSKGVPSPRRRPMCVYICCVLFIQSYKKNKILKILKK